MNSICCMPVSVVLVRLRLHRVKVQSMNLVYERLLSERSQSMNSHCSYSPTSSGVFFASSHWYCCCSKRGGCMMRHYMIILPSKYLFSIFSRRFLCFVFCMISNPFSSNGRKLSGSILMSSLAISPAGMSEDDNCQRRMRYHVAIKREHGYFLDVTI